MAYDRDSILIHSNIPKISFSNWGSTIPPYAGSHDYLDMGSPTSGEFTDVSFLRAMDYMDQASFASVPITQR